MANPFSIRIDDTLKARLEEAARTEDRSLSYIAQKAIAVYLDERDFKHHEIMRAYKDSQGADTISDEAMTEWVESWDTEDKKPAPSTAAKTAHPKAR